MRPRRTIDIVICTVGLGLLVMTPRTWAQVDGPRFAPPRPIDQELDDSFDMGPGDVETKPAPNPGAPPPVTEFRPPQPLPGAAQEKSGKTKFKVVEGAFYEKGKPRGRDDIPPPPTPKKRAIQQ